MVKTTIQVKKRKDKQKQYTTTLPKQLMTSLKTRDKDKLDWEIVDKDTLKARIERK